MKKKNTLFIPLLLPLFLFFSLPPFALSIELREPEILISETQAPSPASTNQSNNNLDVVIHKNETYLAWRTSNNHFASDNTVLHVARKQHDQWIYETSVKTGKDLREPRFLSLNDELFLYFAELGTNPFAFEPGATLFIKKNSQGEWSNQEVLFEEDFIPWRIKYVDNTPLLIGYRGGANIYNTSQGQLTQYVLTTNNGIDWTPYFNEDGAILSSGLSETDFLILDNSILIAGRNEAGDQDGWGSKVCKTELNQLSWTCKSDRRKFDSPLLLEKNGNIFLIARRQVAFKGNYDLQLRWLPELAQDWLHQLAYSLTPKRCAVWRVNSTDLSVAWLADLPSTGDTCFPSALPSSEGFDVYNYSNRWEKAANLAWIQGQLKETVIYKIELVIK